MRGLSLVLLALSVAGCAGGRLKVGRVAGGEVVEAEGLSPIDAEDPAGTKNRALAEAQKRAVEKVVGVYISAKTRVSQAVSVNQNILADVSGYIKKYEILSEKKEEGFLKTRIRALVLYGKVGEDLGRLGLIRPDAPPGNPKLLVRLGEGSGRAAAAVRRVLGQRGYAIVDGQGEADADIVVGGDASAHRLEIKDLNLGGFASYRGRASLEAYSLKTETVIAQGNKEASALDPSPAIAEGKALDSAGGLAAEALADALSKALTGRVDIRLRLAGAENLGVIEGVITDLRTQPDVAMVSLSSYEAGKADLTVTSEGFTGEDLAGLLSRMKPHRFEVTEVRPYAVDARLAK